MLLSLSLLSSLVVSTSALPAASSPHPRSSPFTLPTFTNPASSNYLVPPSSLPLLPTSLQPSYAGLLPISSSPTESRKLFFWYWPSSASGGSAKLSIWLNGGPGCSSLEGWMQENGPVRWEPGQDEPTVNENAWTGVSDVLYVEQPVGTGFTEGTPDITDETQLADEFYGFLQQFYGIFSELASKPLYIAGESYAGVYIPYIATRILNASASEKATLPLALQALLINDGVYTSTIVSEQAPVARFASANQAVLGLSDSQVSTLANISASCGYETMLDLATYPPKGPIPLPNGNRDMVEGGCDLFDQYVTYAMMANPCFNIYRITDKCPTPADPIQPYFSRADVQAALHVPEHGPWLECSNTDVFLNNVDTSPYTLTLLPTLIASLPSGVHLWHGLSDGLLLAQGDRVMIQNLTWGGAQGFTREPGPLVLGGEKVGVWREERGLTYIEVEGAGHMIPQDQPALGLHVFSAVLGLTTL